jgi:hypothetical protein
MKYLDGLQVQQMLLLMTGKYLIKHGIEDDVLVNPKEYVRDIMFWEFLNISDGVSEFKGIQPRSNDQFEHFVLSKFEGYSVNYNFVRISPYKQEEPNFIHTDEMMGDITVLLYLNESFPPNAGTTIYDQDIVIDYKFNRMCYFDSKERHSRNLIDNFDESYEPRLVQVIFLKKI